MIATNGRSEQRILTPPYDLAAERDLLAACLSEPAALLIIGQIVQPVDFYLEANRWTYEAMIALQQRRVKVDVTPLLSELRRAGRLDREQAEAHIGKLYEGGSLNVVLLVEQNARTVRQAAIQRQAIDAGGRIAALGYQQGLAEDALLEGVNRLTAGLQRRAGLDNVRDEAAALASWYDDYEARLNTPPGQILGLRTGFDRLDRITGGLKKKKLYILAARPAVGKSSFALNVMRNVCRPVKHGGLGKTVLLFALEMAVEECVGRLALDLAGVNSLRLENGVLTEDEEKAISAANGELGDWRYNIDETGGLSIAQLTSRAHAVYGRRPFDLIIVDHMQLMSGGKSDNRNVDLGAVSYGLKMLAKDLGVPVLALSQLNRKSEERADHEPLLSDLRESGNLEQDGDLIALLHRPEMYEKDETKRAALAGEALLIVAKHRAGPTARIPLHWDGAHTRFVDVTWRNDYEAA